MYYLKENPHGGNIDSDKPILDFSANTNPLGTPPAVLVATRSALEQVDRYPDPYCRALVRAIAAYEGVPEAYILCGNGAAELIYAYCAAVKPARAAETAPTFSEYSAALALHGRAVARYVLRKETAFTLDGGFLNFLQAERPEALFLCNPNNPTGRLFSPAPLGEIFDFCKQNNIRLFVDECFLELSDGAESLKGRLAEYPGLFLLKAFTKTYGMAGLRLGYGLSADAALLKRMSEAAPPWNVSNVAQAAGIAALKERGFLKKARELMQSERPRLKAALEALGLWVCPSEAIFLLFQGPEGLHAALRERGIAIRGCANFPGLGPGWYRAAVRTREENERLIAAMEEAL